MINMVHNTGFNCMKYILFHIHCLDYIKICLESWIFEIALGMLEPEETCCIDLFDELVGYFEEELSCHW